MTPVSKAHRILSEGDPTKAPSPPSPPNPPSRNPLLDFPDSPIDELQPIDLPNKCSHEPSNDNSIDHNGLPCPNCGLSIPQHHAPGVDTPESSQTKYDPLAIKLNLMNIATATAEAIYFRDPGWFMHIDSGKAFFVWRRTLLNEAGLQETDRLFPDVQFERQFLAESMAALPDAQQLADYTTMYGIWLKCLFGFGDDEHAMSRFREFLDTKFFQGASKIMADRYWKVMSDYYTRTGDMTQTKECWGTIAVSVGFKLPLKRRVQEASLEEIQNADSLLNEKPAEPSSLETKEA
ncbi:hypothetical protein EJ08DRAFT_693563 [Tothia fuscella]|uniref:Uncharacterized protein n=1 Tax=Tothia fuscella TaxID=1048955 RepID=A0A9P4NZD0_9PEZI|nr:hypothetical protein EJ08DRAFT_693563 [Tothia fuscella]